MKVWSYFFWWWTSHLFVKVGDFGILVRSGFTVSKALFFNFLSALAALAGTALVSSCSILSWNGSIIIQGRMPNSLRHVQALSLGKDPGHSSLIEVSLFYQKLMVQFLLNRNQLVSHPYYLIEINIFFLYFFWRHPKTTKLMSIHITSLFDKSISCIFCVADTCHHTSAGFYCWRFYLHCCCRSPTTDAWPENYTEQLNDSVGFPDNVNAGCSGDISSRMTWISISL
jgi:hypothetical protein